MRKTYRKIFIKSLSKQYSSLQANLPFDIIEKDLLKKQWCVHAEPPTTNTKVIQEYLGRYICRIGLSKKKFLYDQKHQLVTLSFKDYRNKNKENGSIPEGKKTLIPLMAIGQILQHALPPYFQKCRYYGLHASACYKKYENSLPKDIKNNNHTVRTVFQIQNS